MASLQMHDNLLSTDALSLNQAQLSEQQWRKIASLAKRMILTPNHLREVFQIQHQMRKKCG